MVYWNSKTLLFSGGIQGTGGPCFVRGQGPHLTPIGDHMEYIKLGVHIWVSVLIMGTMWRLISYHLIASQNETVQHVGRAMAQQY